MTTDPQVLDVSTKQIREALLTAARLSRLDSGFSPLPVHVAIDAKGVIITATNRYIVGERTVEFSKKSEAAAPAEGWYEASELLRWLPAVMPGVVAISIDEHGTLHLSDVAIRAAKASPPSIDQLRDLLSLEASVESEFAIDSRNLAAAIKWLGNDTVLADMCRKGTAAPIWRGSVTGARVIVQTLRRGDR